MPGQPGKVTTADQAGSSIISSTPLAEEEELVL